jgi:membrane protein required for colicin V production
MTLLGMMDSLAGAGVGIFTWTFGISTVFWLLTSLGFKIPEHRSEDTYLYPLIVPVAPVVVAKAVELLPASHRLIKEWKNDYLGEVSIW